jgi:hypothetical protein
MASSVDSQYPSPPIKHRFADLEDYLGQCDSAHAAFYGALESGALFATKAEPALGAHTAEARVKLQLRSSEPHGKVEATVLRYRLVKEGTYWRLRPLQPAAQ